MAGGIVQPGRAGDLRARPAVEGLLQLPTQARGVDVAGDRQDGVVRMVEGLPEALQLGAIDLADVVGGQHPSVGVVLAEQLVVEVGVGQLARVVVARSHPRQHLVPHVPHLALGKRRMQQHVGQQVEAERAVLRQRRAGHGGPLVRGLGVERAADEVDGARDVVGAAGLAPVLGSFAQHRRHEVGDAQGVTRLVVAARSHGQPEADHRQLLARHDDHLHPVRQREAIDLGERQRFGLGRRRSGDEVGAPGPEGRGGRPGRLGGSRLVLHLDRSRRRRRLGRRARGTAEERQQQRRQQHRGDGAQSSAGHLVAPVFGPAAGGAPAGGTAAGGAPGGTTVTRVKLSSTRYFCATRCTSAAVTAR